jgi:NAD(P)-dependent dehydrogenase (short-subunit alcohol dehydrogenase family)
MDARVAVITGGARGIGAAMARAFVRAGMRVVLGDLDEAEAQRTARELGAGAIGVKTDVRDPASVRALADAAADRFGGIDVVCNNAGISPIGALMEASLEDWRLTMDVNFWGVVHGVREFVPRLIAQGRGGHVVNTASMAGLVGMEQFGVYAASKFAVVGLSEALAREVRPQGIKVSVLCPMVVRTTLLETTAAVRGLPAPCVDLDSLGGIGRILDPDDVAACVMAGIDRGDFFIFTHAEQRALLEKRAVRLDEACRRVDERG